MEYFVSADDVTVSSGFPGDVNYARPAQQRTAEHTRTEANQPSRYDIMTSSVAVTLFPLSRLVLCSMLLLFCAVV